MGPGIEKLLQVMASMRAEKKGCPWDKVQTHESLIPYLKEEAAEFIESLKEKGASSPETWEELGDLLFQVVFHSQLLKEKGLTSFDEIANRLAEKLIQRHPHVFDPTHPGFTTPEEVNLAWQELKKRSQKSPLSQAPKGVATQALKDIPLSLGALQRSARMGEKMASYGFDWPSAEDVWDKVKEELGEISEAKNESELKEEVGDLFFALSQYCRKKGWDPEDLLQDSNRKFESRIRSMDLQIQSQNKSWNDFDLTQLEQLWQRSKHKNP